MTAARTEASEERRRRLAAEAEADAVTQLESALQREQGVVLQQAEAARDAAEAKTAALVEEHDATLAGILAASRASTQDATTAAQVYAEEVDMQAAQLAAANKAIEAKAEAQAAVHKAQLLEAEENYRSTALGSTEAEGEDSSSDDDSDDDGEVVSVRKCPRRGGKKPAVSYTYPGTDDDFEEMPVKSTKRKRAAKRKHARVAIDDDDEAEGEAYEESDGDEAGLQLSDAAEDDVRDDFITVTFCAILLTI